MFGISRLMPPVVVWDRASGVQRSVLSAVQATNSVTPNPERGECSADPSQRAGPFSDCIDTSQRPLRPAFQHTLCQEAIWLDSHPTRSATSSGLDNLAPAI